MPTRLERLEAQKQRTKAKIAVAKEADARVDGAIRSEVRKERNARRYVVGALADEAGLFTWTNSDLVGLFVALARLADCPNPVAVLEGLLACLEPVGVVLEDGVAHPTDGAARSVLAGGTVQ
jgi:hypothetical protein